METIEIYRARSLCTNGPVPFRIIYNIHIEIIVNIAIHKPYLKGTMTKRKCVKNKKKKLV